MTREFPDELLSAFLDDELPPAERAQVAQHLTASDADRQLLAELTSLRSEMAALPPVTVKADFTDRVVRAALAEAEKHNAAATVTNLRPSDASRFPARWMIRAAVASAAALAACFVLVMRPWRQDAVPPSGLAVVVDPGQAAQQIATASGQFLSSLRGAIPAEGEAVVLRLRVSKDVPLADALDAALSKAGITALASDFSTGAASLMPAYRSTLEAKYGPTQPGTENKALVDGTIAAAHAVFIEAPLERLEAAFGELKLGLKQSLAIEPQGMLAYVPPQKLDQGEGEPGSATKITPRLVPGQPYAQRLSAEVFRLEKKLVKAANAAVNKQPPATQTQQPAISPVTPQQLMRVLILVEIE